MIAQPVQAVQPATPVASNKHLLPVMSGRLPSGPVAHSAAVFRHSQAAQKNGLGAGPQIRQRRSALIHQERRTRTDENAEILLRDLLPTASLCPRACTIHPQMLEQSMRSPTRIPAPTV